jgi:hypothetical protein
VILSGLFPSSINFSAPYDRSLILDRKDLKPAFSKAKRLGIKILVEFEMNIQGGLLPQKYQNLELTVLDSFDGKFKSWLENQDKNIELENFEIQKKNFLKNFAKSNANISSTIAKDKVKSYKESRLNSFNSMESLSHLMRQQYFSKGNLV